ncbi:MAG: SUMF1/EgtB/PvdO family nonheme iron enzyme [Bacteroidota bacterium]
MKRFIFLFAAMLQVTMLLANGVSVSNASLTGKNTTSQTILVQFDLTWSNSWHKSGNPVNWDAVWLFVKFRKSGGNWQHALLGNTGFSSPSGSNIDIGFLNPASAYNSNANPGLGAFIYTSTTGTSGTNNFSPVQLQWNYGDNGVADDDLVDIRVFAVEMVYVRGGVFIVGTNGTESGSFTGAPWSSGASLSFIIPSESSISILNSSGHLWGTSSSGTNTIGGAGSLPDAFPKGFNPFYCMKYEVTQQQYVDFLNTLTYTQQAARTDASVPPNSAAGSYLFSGNSSRYQIQVSSPGVSATTPAIYSTTSPYVACAYTAWADQAAFLDWSGLRPMTELEYEKACRGGNSVVHNEYAWGSISATGATGITNPGNADETATNAANSNYGSGLSSPMRVGTFATSGTTKQTSGSSFSGMMEMSGNLTEPAVTVGNATGRGFTGIHGDGTLNAAGDANVSLWPGTDAVGMGFRGGSWNDGSSAMQVSDRSSAVLTSTTRSETNGIRGVRNPPADIVPPVPGSAGTLSVSGITPISMLIGWSIGTDNNTIPSKLLYGAYYSTNNNISTVATCEANGTLAGTYVANVTGKQLSGLSSGTTYWVNTIIRDEAGNKAIYAGSSGTTTNFTP